MNFSPKFRQLAFIFITGSIMALCTNTLEVQGGTHSQCKIVNKTDGTSRYQPYCKSIDEVEPCYHQLCQEEDPYNEGGKVAFCCWYSFGKRHGYDCCTEREYCKESPNDYDICTTIWYTRSTWVWLLIAAGLLFVPIVIILVCSVISGCPLYRYRRSRGHNTGSLSEAVPNVRYNRSGNVTMTIPRRLYNSSTSTTHNGQTTNSPTPLYPAPPPSYSEITGGKAISVPQSQFQGHVNHSMIPDVETTLPRTSLQESPPSYESIQ